MIKQWMSIIYHNHNLRFADDIDGLTGTTSELANLIKEIEYTLRAYGMEINAMKPKSRRILKVNSHPNLTKLSKPNLT